MPDEGKKAILFVGPNGQMFVYRRGYGSRNGDVLYSNGPAEDGTTTFYAVSVKGFEGTSLAHGFLFDVPKLNFGGKLIRDYDTLTCTVRSSTETYARRLEGLDLATATVVELDPVFTIDGLGRTNDGRYVLVLFERLSGDHYIFFDGRLVETSRYYRNFERGEVTVVAAFEGHEVVISPRGSAFDTAPMEYLRPRGYNVEYDLDARTARITKRGDNEVAED